MFCPTCGQQQVAESVRFCSRCGFLLTGVSEVVANNGLIPNQPVQIAGEIKDSPRKRGIKQGSMIMLVGMLLIVPLLAMLHIATDTEPYIMMFAGIISFWGGILRIIYAYMYEAKDDIPFAYESNVGAPNILQSPAPQNFLPAEQSIPASVYAPPAQGNWMDTNDLAQPSSVIDNTTKLLKTED